MTIIIPESLPPQVPEELINILSDLTGQDIPPVIRSVLGGLLTDGLIGGLDAAVFNGVSYLPAPVQGLVGSLYGSIRDKDSLSDTTRSALETVVGEGRMDAITGVFSSAKALTSGNLTIDEVFDGLSSTTNLLKEFGAFKDFAIPGTQIIKTASTLFSLGGLKPDLGLLAGQGLGLAGALGIYGSPAGLVTSLVAPSIGKLFGGGLFGGGSDPRNSCPCLEKCRKTDHFISENSTNLLQTCAPVMNSSLALALVSEGGGDILGGLFA
jgi:hypothetical protein